MDDSSESSPHPGNHQPLTFVSLLHKVPILRLYLPRCIPWRMLDSHIQKGQEPGLFYSLILLIIVDKQLVSPFQDTPSFLMASAFSTFLISDRYLE